MSKEKGYYSRQYVAMTAGREPIFIPDRNLVLVSMNHLGLARGDCIKLAEPQKTLTPDLDNLEGVAEVTKEYRVSETGILITTDRTSEQLKGLYFFSKDKEDIGAVIENVKLPHILF